MYKLKTPKYFSAETSGMILIDMDRQRREAFMKYFESMVTYRITGLISSLTALQVRLLQRATELSPEEMDRELHRLENLKRSLGESQ